MRIPQRCQCTSKFKVRKNPQRKSYLHNFLLPKSLGVLQPRSWSNSSAVRMAKVFLQVYDITNSPSARTNAAIVHINRVTKDAMGLGGIFHGAVQVFDQEWSFGYCERGSGVFSCSPKCNPMYTWRETIELGTTEMDEKRIKELIVDLGLMWEGCTYDLLNRNCNHFCERFCKELGVNTIPPWVNRFANVGDSASEVIGNTTEHLKQFGNEFVSASKQVARYISTMVAPSDKDARIQNLENADETGNNSNHVSTSKSDNEENGDETHRHRFLPFYFKNPPISSNLLPYLAANLHQRNCS